MATWADTKGFIAANYRYEEVNDTLLKLVFDTGGLRSQLVFVAWDKNSEGVEWIRVNSPIGPVGEVDIARAATRLGDMIVGGIVVIGDYAYVTNAVPLLNLDANELVEPMVRVLSIADQLEGELLGRDQV
ncbi:MAG: hypothetical protein NT132_04090 [Microbacterium sp.]|uniref:hypothetical protein n=1 Tax=Microbacterium sp. TaxID=51671 RepID=UPI0026244F8E|nr:hypothetical protein [Microbacterium sp.]MCX6501580.1 hypothetical protein [Microbacterium sp.]